jgi:predicted nucleic acid-binding protein
MPEKIIISDTSSLIALTNIGELELLKKVYGEVVITPEIGEEYGLETPDWIRIEKIEDVQKFKLLNLELDKGESSGITLALENEASLLIIDEKKGRGIAKKLGIRITGILGVMIRAKEIGVINRVKPLIEKLEKVDFRMSERLKNQILERVGE